jgi:hypothetical protein
MLRSIGVAVVLTLTGVVALAADGDKKPAANAITGKIKAVDVPKGMLTLTTGGEGNAKDMQFSLAGAKLLSGRNEIKAADLKVGDTVSVTPSADGKTASQVVVGAAKRRDKK